MSTAPLQRVTMSGVSFGGIIRSEWIKLRSLRSTVWCYAIIVVLTLGVGALIAFAMASGATGGAGITGDAATTMAVQTATFPISMTQLVAAVLGALVITGEYGTGMIRSTLTAVPKRLPALVGKALVFALTTFLVSAVAIAVTGAMTLAMLSGAGIGVEITAGYLLALVGGAGYLALVGLLSFAIGAIIRSSAGGIAASLGLILVVPNVLPLLAFLTKADWIGEAAKYLPSNAGAQMYALAGSGAVDMFTGATVLEPAIGLLVLVGWVVALLALAAVLLKRRDA
ncbi:MAG: ABC transporter permease [Burkholderiaceae bacterium]|nr:ABC transporter permease [Microbacteriaceae bacterium]